MGVGHPGVLVLWGCSGDVMWWWDGDVLDRGAPWGPRCEGGAGVWYGGM